MDDFTIDVKITKEKVIQKDEPTTKGMDTKKYDKFMKASFKLMKLQKRKLHLEKQLETLLGEVELLSEDIKSILQID